MRRNPDGAPDPGIRLVGLLRGRPGSAAASSVVDRERSRSRAHEEGDGSGGGETANFAALIARAENVEERHRDDAVDAAGQLLIGKLRGVNECKRARLKSGSRSA